MRLVDPCRRHVVEEEERIGAAAQHVVDAVRGQIHPGGAQSPGASRQHQLRADSVRRRRQQSMFVQRI